jgi:hypothetical protein
MFAKNQARDGSRWTRRAIGAAMVLPLAVSGLIAQALIAAPGALATTSHCLVINNAIDTSYPTLQAAVNAASPGATLWVRGTCTGTTVIGTSLTLTGQHPSGFTAPTLNGGGQGSVLTIDSGAAVTVNTLTITGGSAAHGGGIKNFGTVTLNDATISGNTVTDSGGGIHNFGTVTLNDGSSITGNTAAPGGGLGFGGGIQNENFGTVTLNDGSSITGNTAGGGGGGINNFGTVTLNDSSSITGNTAGGDGGGILNEPTGTVTLNGSSSITGNHPDNCSPQGSVTGCTG